MNYDPLEYFRQKYPLEYTMFFEVMTRFANIRGDIYPDTKESTDLPHKIEFTVDIDERNQKPIILTEPDGMFFLAAISRTMIESLYSDNPHIIKELEEKAKKRVYKNIKIIICSNCRYSNDLAFEYCEKCGTKLR